MATGAPARIPAFDPQTRRGPVYRAMSWFLNTRAGRGTAMKFSAKVDPTLLRWSHGRIGTGLVFPSVALTTTGAKSGQPRTAAVLYFSDGDDVILLASNFGTERHPAWYHNLRAHPTALLECGGVRAAYTAAEVTDAAEWQRLWDLALGVYPGWAQYKERTDAVGIG